MENGKSADRFSIFHFSFSKCDASMRAKTLSWRKFSFLDNIASPNGCNKHRCPQLRNRRSFQQRRNAMIRRLTIVLSACLCIGLASAEDAVKPIKALLVCGGCCHDYTHQKDILKKGLEERAHIEVTAVQEGGAATSSKIPLYEDKPEWSKGYDIVIHDECFADVKDVPYVENVLNPHKEGLPGVNLHCAMHCYRTGQDIWFKYIGIQSSGHGAQKPIDITFVDKEHPISKGLEDWVTINEELYNNIKVFDTAHALARGKQTFKQKDGTDKVEDVVVVWTNEYGDKKTRVFNTTIGHNNATVGDPRYIDLVAKGIIWACNKPEDQYLKPRK
jgi:type 1 glutamine amidotransferase